MAAAKNEDRMMKKDEGKMQDNALVSEEACRRVMIFLCGDEENAEKFGEALLRAGTTEDEISKMRLRLGQKIADDVARRRKYTVHPRLREKVRSWSEPRSLAQPEEDELNLFIRETYSRLTAEGILDASDEIPVQQQHDIVPDHSHGLHLRQRVGDVIKAVKTTVTEALSNALDVPARAAAALSAPVSVHAADASAPAKSTFFQPVELGSLDFAEGRILFLDGGKATYVRLPSLTIAANIRLGSNEYPLTPVEEHGGEFLVVGLNPGDAHTFLVQHKRDPARYTVSWR